MISIELTQEHKDKLIEMCEFLFPKYDFRILSEYFGINDNSHIHGDQNNIIIFSKKTNTWVTTFHWFEFCMTHLSHAIIFNPKNSLRACNHNHAGLLESVMHLFYNEKQAIHPVDYLYDEFKKLK